MPTEALGKFFYCFSFLSRFFEHAHSLAEEGLYCRRRSFVLFEEVTNRFGFLRPGFLAGFPSCLMHDRCCDSCPLLSNRDSSGAKKRSMMGFNFFWHISVYILFSRFQWLSMGLMLVRWRFYRIGEFKLNPRLLHY